MSKTRKILFRLGAILLLLVIAGTMLIVGRGHTVYIDSKKIEYNGQTYAAPYKAVIFVNGDQVAKLYDKERGMSLCIGQKFTMTIELTEIKGGEEITKTYTIRLPYSMDGILINLPAFLAGLPQAAYLSEFVITPAEPAADEEIIGEEFIVPEDDIADAG